MRMAGNTRLGREQGRGVRRNAAGVHCDCVESAHAVPTLLLTPPPLLGDYSSLLARARYCLVMPGE